MLHDLARKRAHLQDAVAEEFRNARDGNPRAQQKMAARMLAAGAAQVKLEPGKRGRYSLFFYEWAGWDPIRDQAICVGDPIPEKPWIAWHLTLIDSYGRGRLDVTSVPALLITHHALSRTAQRLGLRTDKHLLVTAGTIWNAAAGLINRQKGAWVEPPAQGWRAPLETVDGDAAVVVLKRHESRKALVAATVFNGDKA